MHGSRKRTSACFLFFVLLAAGLARCGPVSRVEPAVGERPEVVDRITASWKEAGTLAGVRAMAERFVRAWRDGEHEAAWDMLSPAWRQRFTDVAGDRDPKAFFARSRLPRTEGAVPWDPIAALFGERLMYLSLPTEEMGVREIPGVLLVYAVQDDGTWTSFRVVTVADERYIEPIMVME